MTNMLRSHRNPFVFAKRSSMGNAGPAAGSRSAPVLASALPDSRRSQPLAQPISIATETCYLAEAIEGIAAGLLAHRDHNPGIVECAAVLLYRRQRGRSQQVHLGAEQRIEARSMTASLDVFGL